MGRKLGADLMGTSGFQSDSDKGQGIDRCNGSIIQNGFLCSFFRMGDHIGFALLL